jgi:uncharacterized membrane protein
MSEQNENRNDANGQSGEQNQSENKIREDAIRADIEQNKIFAALGYIVFFIPLLACKDSPFGRYHANQALVLFITAVLTRIVGAVIPFIGWFIIWPLGGLFVLILIVIGFVNAINGYCKPLPVIGTIKLI